MNKFVIPVTLLIVSMASVVCAQETLPGADSESVSQQAELDERVWKILARMTEQKLGAQTFSVVAEMGHDVPQANGQNLEAGSIVTASFRRPSQASVRVDNRDGDSATIVLDGKNISVFSARENTHVYDIITQPGDIDVSFQYLVQQLGATYHLEYLFSVNATESLKRNAESAHYAGEAKIAGVVCDHLAIRNAAEDLQLWITKGNQPVLRRIVVTYRKLEGQPRFWAQFIKWEFSPVLSDSDFQYSPPAAAERVSLFQD